MFVEAICVDVIFFVGVVGADGMLFLFFFRRVVGGYVIISYERRSTPPSVIVRLVPSAVVCICICKEERKFE